MPPTLQRKESLNMPNCQICNIPLQRNTAGNYKCRTCGFIYKPGQTTPLLQNYIKQQLGPAENDGLDPDQRTFIDRIMQSIIPIHADYTEEAKSNLHKVQQRYRQRLIDVFNGKGTFDKWFQQTRTTLGIHAVDLTRKICESLEGLQSLDARQMRQQWEQALQEIVSSYKPGV